MRGLVVEAGLGITNLAVLGLVARARHLLRRAYDLADAGDATSAAILMRGITESVFTLAWLKRIPNWPRSFGCWTRSATGCHSTRRSPRPSAGSAGALA